MPGEPDERMNVEAGSKVCRFCAEPIKAEARVCPHCRHWQKWRSLGNPLMLGTLWIGLMFFVMGGLCVFMESQFGPKRSFAEYRDQIGVMDFQASRHATASNSILTVVGMLTNRSEFGWKDVGVEARFLDHSGKLLDTITVTADSYRGVAILPHGAASFKIEGRTFSDWTNYDHCETIVRWAKDVDSF